MKCVVRGMRVCVGFVGGSSVPWLPHGRPVGVRSTVVGPGVANRRMLCAMHKSMVFTVSSAT